MSQYTGTKRILRNPLLTNASKWLNDVPKKHHSKFLQSGVYNRNALDCNPYVQSLIKVDANSGATVLPVGNAIRLTAAVDDTASKKSQVTLHPSLHLENKPSRLISNSKAYMELVQGNSRLAHAHRPMQLDKSFLPSKFKVDFVENMGDVIERSYRERIESLLSSIQKDEMGTDGIHLIEMDGVSRWEDGRLKVNKGLVGLTDDTFISFRNNPELARIIVAFCDYKSC
ncbi:hypothetical protein KGF57_003147 [Candida theae]|uniref:Uncharacterized protein n=1 Tax=Candida theae TaxID=1198502 RepID=A0AAD5BDR8_9ASCO|nr:uncharacterized protein KGF57_003147 [Candida theae]KAI5957453.1 hypothetical protein KGF57_003147 [Candida theae]